MNQPSRDKALKQREGHYLFLWRSGYPAHSSIQLQYYNKFFRNPHLKGQYGSTQKRKLSKRQVES